MRGLDSFPAEDRPDTRVVHVAFQVMVGAGSWLALLALAALALRVFSKKKPSWTTEPG